MSDIPAYSADRSLKGKLRRRLVRLAERRPAKRAPDRPMVSFSFDDAPAREPAPRSMPREHSDAVC